jgi:UDP-N-acetylmuramate dehydrogenase
MEIKENISLKPYNTFGIDISAAKFAEVSSIKELKEVLRSHKGSLLILGGGSNVLFTKNYD